MWKVLSFSVGACLVYLEAFTYETEQKRLQNRLENWWVRIDDLSASGLRRHSAFMVVVAQITTACFDAVFGPELMSLACLGASMAYSLAGPCLIGVIFRSAIVAIVQLRVPVVSVATQAIWAAVYLVLGNLRALAPRLIRAQFWLTTGVFTLEILMYRRNLWLFCGVSPGSSHQFIIYGAKPSTMDQLIIYGGGIGFTIVFGIVFIAMTRWLVRWGAASVSFIRTSSLLVITLLMGLGFIIVPVVLFAVTLRRLSPWPMMWTMVLVDNIFIALAATAFFVLFAALMLVHRLLWPVIARPLYLVTSKRLLMHRRALVCAGLAFIGMAAPGIAGLLKELSEWVRFSVG